MYATSSEHTRVPWAAHSYNVAFSDEIGHFEYCSAVAREGGRCTSNGEYSLDGDDAFCFTAALSLFVPIGGCTATDNDFDGTSYEPVWPGTDPNRGQDKKFHPSPITFTSPLFNGSENYSRVAFEADLPRIEAADSGGGLTQFAPVTRLQLPPKSAAWFELLPDLLDGDVDAESECERALRLAVRRVPPQGDDEHLRRKLGRGVRTAAVQFLPGDPGQDEQLPQRPELQPLPGLAPDRVETMESAPSGALSSSRHRPEGGLRRCRGRCESSSVGAPGSAGSSLVNRGRPVGNDP